MSLIWLMQYAMKCKKQQKILIKENEGLLNIQIILLKYPHNRLYCP